MEVDLRPGGHYRLAMQGEGARMLAVHGRFLEVEPGSRLVYTWRWDGAFADMPETIVTVEFCAAGDGTEVALRQEPLAMRYCAQHLSGWLAAWDRMAGAVLEVQSAELLAERERVL